jgi:hypothetical protein
MSQLLKISLSDTTQFGCSKNYKIMASCYLKSNRIDGLDSRYSCRMEEAIEASLSEALLLYFRRPLNLERDIININRCIAIQYAGLGAWHNTSCKL